MAEAAAHLVEHVFPQVPVPISAIQTTWKPPARRTPRMPGPVAIQVQRIHCAGLSRPPTEEPHGVGRPSGTLQSRSDGRSHFSEIRASGSIFE
jgi:hypothetical protein